MWGEPNHWLKCVIDEAFEDNTWALTALWQHPEYKATLRERQFYKISIIYVNWFWILHNSINISVNFAIITHHSLWLADWLTDRQLFAVQLLIKATFTNFYNFIDFRKNRRWFRKTHPYKKWAERPSNEVIHNRLCSGSLVDSQCAPWTHYRWRVQSQKLWSSCV